MESILNFSIFLLVMFVENVSCDPVPNTTPFPTSTLQRIRDHRLSALRSYILESLGFPSPPQINQSRQDAWAMLNEYRNRRIYENRCYLPTCSLPRRINSTLWNEGDTNEMNFYFDVITFTVGEADVHNATLRVRVQPKPACLGCPGNNEDRRFIVSLYQYVKPLKKKKKTKLIGANMVVWSRRQHWLYFNVLEAAREWALDAKKNNGFLIRIQSLQESFNITNLFYQPDCSAPLDIVECNATEVPSPFRLPISAILEIYTEKSIF